MILQQGDVFTASTPFLAHGVNVDGVMGAGVAAVVRRRFPYAHSVYTAVCRNHGLAPGECLAILDDDTIVLNVASQDRPGPAAKYEWVFQGLMAACREALDYQPKLTIAMPQIGCGIGGLKWPVVAKIIETVEVLYPTVTFEVWEYQA